MEVYAVFMESQTRIEMQILLMPLCGKGTFCANCGANTPPNL